GGGAAAAGGRRRPRRCWRLAPCPGPRAGATRRWCSCCWRPGPTATHGTVTEARPLTMRLTTARRRWCGCSWTPARTRASRTIRE
ncbi:unnamed protein product, partial [Heterosigma akashiwo]